MPKEKAAIEPLCLHCGKLSRRVTGRVIYPKWEEKHDLIFYQCEPCGAYVGSHKKSGKPLGYPGNKETRNARQEVHKILDPIWKGAWTLPEYGQIDASDSQAKLSIMRSARSRTYRFLAACMEIDRKDCHTAMFTIEQCRFAWVICKGINYKVVRDWHKANEEHENLKK